MNYSQKELQHIKENITIIKEIVDWLSLRGANIQWLQEDIAKIINIAIDIHLIEWYPHYFIIWFREQARMLRCVRNQ